MDAMDIMPRNVPADELQALIETARADLAAAEESPFIRRDPYRLLLSATGDTLAVFGRSITRWERAVQDVIDARVLSDEDRAAIVTATEDGAYKAMRKEANRIVRTIDRRLATQIGLTAAGAFVAGAVAVLAVQFLGQVGPRSPAAERNAAWSALIQSNPDPNPALASAEIRTDQTGRRYYAKLSLWLDPANPPPK
jgi:hypothetical protein